jgi:hypothetical protein
MYNITENIYYSQLSSFALLLQPESNCFTSYSTRKGLGSLSRCAVVLRSSPPSHMSTCNGQRSSQLSCVHYSFVRNASNAYCPKVMNISVLTVTLQDLDQHISCHRPRSHFYLTSRLTFKCVFITGNGFSLLLISFFLSRSRSRLCHYRVGVPGGTFVSTGCSKSHATHGEMQYNFFIIMPISYG